MSTYDNFLIISGKQEVLDDITAVLEKAKDYTTYTNNIPYKAISAALGRKFNRPINGGYVGQYQQYIDANSNNGFHSLLLNLYEIEWCNMWLLNILLNCVLGKWEIDEDYVWEFISNPRWFSDDSYYIMSNSQNIHPGSTYCLKGFYGGRRYCVIGSKYNFAKNSLTQIPQLRKYVFEELEQFLITDYPGKDAHHPLTLRKYRYCTPTELFHEDFD